MSRIIVCYRCRCGDRTLKKVSEGKYECLRRRDCRPKEKRISVSQDEFNKLKEV